MQGRQIAYEPRKEQREYIRRCYIHIEKQSCKDVIALVALCTRKPRFFFHELALERSTKMYIVPYCTDKDFT